MKRDLINRIINRLVLGFFSAATYLPVIAGIITPMLYLLPAWYSAWYVVGFIFPFNPIWGGLWLPDLPPIAYLSIWTIEGILFLWGLILFILALFEMARKFSGGTSLVTTGPYRWARHPQHLGIIMFLLPLALFNIHYSTYWSGIRPGDVLSWSLVSFLLIVTADLEEYTLIKRFGSEYIVYSSRTPFLLQGVSLFGFMDNYPILSKRKPLRYIIWFFMYWCVVSLILYGFTFVELAWTL
ncbi:MAG: methyltransferase family protein [Candidatus Thorarchaeota archaeon]